MLNLYGKKLKKNIMLYVYVITESGACILTISTKLQNKYRSILYRHEIKEKRRLLPILSPMISLTWAAFQSLESDQAWVPMIGLERG